MSIAEWLLREAKAIGVEGATFAAAQGGFGRDGKYHCAQGSDHGREPRTQRTALCPHRAGKAATLLHENSCGIWHHLY